MPVKNSKSNIIIAVFVVLIAVVLTLLRHWEPSGETWIYWFFSRIFKETGKFPIMGRSPLYTLYLCLFRWLEFPTCVIVEYIVTLFITLTALVSLLKKRTGILWAVFAVLLWLPFFQEAEPPVQNLALALTCIAAILREDKKGRFAFSLSYSLMFVAVMLRPTYIIFIFVFALWDSVKLLREKGWRNLLSELSLKLQDLPLFILIILFIWFNVMQSDHRWNNAWAATTRWFPCKGKTLIEASFIGHFNWVYTFQKYGIFEGRDFYFTNQELFGGADTVFKAIRANPAFVFRQLISNLKGTFYTIGNMTMLPTSFNKKIVAVIFVFIILYGALRSCKNKSMLLFVVASVISAVISNILSLPKARYMVAFVPIFILSAYWYGEKIASASLKFNFSRITIPICLVIFSSAVPNWRVIAIDITDDIKSSQLRVMQQRPYSLRASFQQIEPLIKDCRGVLSFEHTFIGAFTDMPLSKVYDIWEIPPFGNYGGSGDYYDGLRNQRIDCILVSHDLATSIGFATNSYIRYQNYILPYIKQLQNTGAKIYDIEKFGQVVILGHHNQ